ncbi:hypothetical protein [Acetobacter sp.]|uniref:hypothetical protein n=1 Tax=Acetobacter sp. TaxID=440 RepID=UPI0039ECFF12
MRSMVRKLTFITAGLSAIVVASSHSAHAERVLSDFEASKLTLESLTAAPVYHAPVHHYRVATAASSSRHHVAVASRSSRPMVHLVSFHVVKPSVSKAHAHHRT